MVYFVRREDGLIKIGTTIRLSERLKALAKLCGQKVEVLGVRPGGLEEEGLLHVRFGDLRVEGEWFRSGVELCRFIDEESMPWDGEDEATTAIIGIRCTAAFKAHLERLAEMETRNPSQFIERALRQYAERSSYMPFPRR